MIGWFFFELLVLGAVIDYESATTFRLHNKATWHFYIEVLRYAYMARRVHVVDSIFLPFKIITLNNRFIVCTKLFISF